MQFCCTDVTIHTFEYTWTIKKFGLHLKLSNQHKNDVTLKSAPCFIGNGNNNTEWFFQLILHGNQSDYKEFIGIAALPKDPADTKPANEMRSWQKYYFLNSRNERMQIHNTLDSSTLSSWECKEFYNKRKLLDESELFLVNDELTIICQINVMGDPITINENRVTETTTTTTTNKKSLANDIAMLFTTKKYSDVTFVLENNVRIEAHKTILMARSAVFAEIIDIEQQKQQEMKRKDEKDNNLIIELKDLFYVPFTELLRYIYTDKVENLEDMEMYLLSASYEYQLEGLRVMCVNSLCRTISIECAMGTLEMATRYQCEPLIEFTKKFIFSRLADVVCTNEFQCMLMDNPELLEKLLVKNN